tara:strand:+ start:254 stop:493 length:240 start_codon:yes stop_codon:yes gene_type:complete
MNNTIQIHETYRIYKNKKDVIQAFSEDKDFRVNDFNYGFGMATNRADLLNIPNIENVKIRYNKLEDVIFINIKSLKEAK